MKIPQIIQLNEFLPYFLVGLVSTFIDWTSFWVTTGIYDFHYEVALIISYTLAGSFHYTANKIITFKCRSKKIASQFSIYFIVTVISLFMSMGLIALIKFFIITSLYARMITTALMLIPNFLLHKHVTFSKKLFRTDLNHLS